MAGVLVSGGNTCGKGLGAIGAAIKMELRLKINLADILTEREFGETCSPRAGLGELTPPNSLPASGKHTVFPRDGATAAPRCSGTLPAGGKHTVSPRDGATHSGVALLGEIHRLASIRHFLFESCPSVRP